MESNEMFRMMVARIMTYYASKGEKIEKKGIAERAAIPVPVFSELLSGSKSASPNNIMKLRVAFQEELNESLILKIAPLLNVLVNHVVFLECEVFSSNAQSAAEAIKSSTIQLTQNLKTLDFFDIDDLLRPVSSK